MFGEFKVLDMDSRKPPTIGHQLIFDYFWNAPIWFKNGWIHERIRVINFENSAVMRNFVHLPVFQLVMPNLKNIPGSR